MELITNVPSEIAQVLQAVLVLVIVATREYATLAFDRASARRKAKERGAVEFKLHRQQESGGQEMSNPTTKGRSP